MSWSRNLSPVFRKGFLLRPAASLDGQGDGERADVAEVEVGREAAGSGQFGMVAGWLVTGEIVADELVEAAEGGVRAAGEGVDRLDGAVELGESVGDVLVE